MPITYSFLLLLEIAMSQDIKIQNKCDHQINWESLNFEQDRVSIYLTYPVAATVSVLLKINNVIVPQTSYFLYKRSDVLTIDQTWAIQLRTKNKLYQPLIEAQYLTFSRYCPKCVGVNVLDDLIYSQKGDFLMAEKEYLLVQNVEKYIVTNLSSNIFHNWVGTNLNKLVGKKIFDLDLLNREIISEVNNAMDKLRTVQTQLLATAASVDPGEILDKVLSITTEKTDDPTTVMVTVSFTAKSGKPIEYSQFLELAELRERRAF